MDGGLWGGGLVDCSGMANCGGSWTVEAGRGLRIVKDGGSCVEDGLQDGGPWRAVDRGGRWIVEGGDRKSVV